MRKNREFSYSNLMTMLLKQLVYMICIFFRAWKNTHDYIFFNYFNWAHHKHIKASAKFSSTLSLWWFYQTHKGFDRMSHAYWPCAYKKSVYKISGLYHFLFIQRVRKKKINRDILVSKWTKLTNAYATWIDATNKKYF